MEVHGIRDLYQATPGHSYISEGMQGVSRFADPESISFLGKTKSAKGGMRGKSDTGRIMVLWNLRHRWRGEAGVLHRRPSAQYRGTHHLG